MRVSSKRSASRTTSVSDVAGVISNSDAQTPICSEASTSNTRSGCRTARPQAALTAIVDFPTPPLLLTNEMTLPKRPASRTGRPLDAAEQLGQFAAGDGPPQEVLHARAKGLNENRAFRHVGLKTVGPKDSGDDGLGRDDRRFLGKGLQRPDIGSHFDQCDVRSATAGRLDCLAGVAGIVNHGM